MAKAATITGVLLIATALFFLIAAGEFHITALIPAFIGIPILICGLIARDESKRKHAMHAAIIFAFLGVLGSASRAFQLPAILSGGEGNRLAIFESAAMFVICLVFVILCVQSFIAARKARAV